MKRLFTPLLLLLGGFTQAQNDGDAIFASSSVHDIYLNFSQTSYWDTLMANHTADVYTRCDMTFDGITFTDVGVKLKGNSSFNNSSVKKSMKIDMNEYVAGQDIDGLKKFNLNNGFKDPTFIREKITLDFMRDHGAAAPKCTYGRVYLNNTYWGLYMIVEDINDKFCTQRYGNNDGNRFKGDPSGDLRWLGSAASNYYSKYELDNNETINDWSDLVHLIDIINNTPAAQLYDSLETVLYTWGFVYQWAGYNVFANLDSYIGSGHNYFIYHNSNTGKFEWIPWDVNESFGVFAQQMSISQLENLSWNYLNQANNRPLCNNMLQNTTYTSMYINALCDLSNDFTNSNLDPKIDSLANVIRTDVYNDTQKFYSSQDFETNMTSNLGNIPGLKSFITNRHNSLISQLSAYGCWLGINENEQANTIRSYPNPFSSSCTIELPEGWDASSCTLNMHDLSGKDVTGMMTITRANGLIVIERSSSCASGMYLATIGTEGQSPVRVKLTISD
ncbi:MAG: spore coat protein CotH [Bacteroidetes bacterium]|nr:MAG: spore coat protein CotH [Bacteroidota bacterium]